jgi:hypothetical protein
MRLSRAVVPRMRATFSGRDGAALSDLFDEAVPREEGRLLLMVTAQMAANVRQGTVLHLALVILSGGRGQGLSQVQRLCQGQPLAGYPE